MNAIEEREAENRGMLIAARILCVRCRRGEELVIKSGAFTSEDIMHGKQPCVAWKIHKELASRGRQ